MENVRSSADLPPAQVADAVPVGAEEVDEAAEGGVAADERGRGRNKRTDVAVVGPENVDVFGPPGGVHDDRRLARTEDGHVREEPGEAAVDAIQHAGDEDEDDGVDPCAGAGEA